MLLISDDSDESHFNISEINVHLCRGVYLFEGKLVYLLKWVG